MAIRKPISQVALRIREIRERKSLTTGDLAERIGMSRLRVWRLETGVQAITADAALDFARALGVPVADLYRRSRKRAA